MANDKVTKQISFDKANYEFIQSIYGDIAPSVIVNILLTSLREELQFRGVNLDAIKKSAIKDADEKLRSL